MLKKQLTPSLAQRVTGRVGGGETHDPSQGASFYELTSEPHAKPQQTSRVGVWPFWVAGFRAPRDVTFWHFFSLFVSFWHPVLKMPKMDKRCQKLTENKISIAPRSLPALPWTPRWEDTHLTPARSPHRLCRLCRRGEGETLPTP